MPSPESIAIRKNIHKETAPSELPLEEQRKAWIEYARTLKTAEGVEQKDDYIAGIPCLWLSKLASETLATILYLHGGGFVDGAIATHREFVSRLAQITAYRVLMIEYRLAPEHPFPSALDDVINVYETLIGEGRLKASETVFGGDSSGGGLALSAMTRLRDEGKELPSCGFAISGVFDMTLSAESMTSRNEIDPCLSYEALKGWLGYFDEVEDLSNPFLSPLFGRLEGIPPLLLQVGDHEVWRDDSTRLAARIRSAGGDVHLSVWDSMWHVWHMYPDLPEAREAIEGIGSFLDEYEHSEYG